MQISAAIMFADKLVEPFEAFRAKPYQDQRGFWTQGFGSRAKPDGTPITASSPPIDYWTAVQWMSAALGKVAARVNDLVKVDITDRQRGALYSLVYNIGGNAFANSTLLRVLNAGKTEAAMLHFMDWVMCDGKPDNGLIRRRQAEQALFKLDLPAAAGGAAPVVPGNAAAPPAPPPAETTDELNAQELAQISQNQAWPRTL